MWGLKTTAVSVVMGALGTIRKDMENYNNKIPGNINIQELQKINLLSTAHLFSGGSSPSSSQVCPSMRTFVFTVLLITFY